MKKNIAILFAFILTCFTVNAQRSMPAQTRRLERFQKTNKEKNRLAARQEKQRNHRLRMQIRRQRHHKKEKPLNPEPETTSTT